MLLSGPNRGDEEKNTTDPKAARNESEPILSHRPGKEPVIRDVNDDISPSTRKQGCPRSMREYVDIESDGESDVRIEGRQSRQPFRGRSPYKGYSREVSVT